MSDDIAVCIFCGAIKTEKDEPPDGHGVSRTAVGSICKTCSRNPQSERDLFAASVLTSEFMPAEKLMEIGCRIHAVNGIDFDDADAKAMLAFKFKREALGDTQYLKLMSAIVYGAVFRREMGTENKTARSDNGGKHQHNGSNNADGTRWAVAGIQAGKFVKLNGELGITGIIVFPLSAGLLVSISFGVSPWVSAAFLVVLVILYAVVWFARDSTWRRLCSTVWAISKDRPVYVRRDLMAPYGYVLFQSEQAGKWTEFSGCHSASECAQLLESVGK